MFGWSCAFMVSVFKIVSVCSTQTHQNWCSSKISSSAFFCTEKLGLLTPKIQKVTSIWTWSKKCIYFVRSQIWCCFRDHNKKSSVYCRSTSFILSLLHCRSTRRQKGSEQWVYTRNSLNWTHIVPNRWKRTRGQDNWIGVMDESG